MSKAAEKIRRAMILAAGKSRRLEELHLSQPKPTLEIGGQPLLLRHLEHCAEAGIEEVFINLHYLPEQIRALAGDGARWTLRITYREEAALAGTAGGVKGFADDLRGEPFLVIYGDNYCTFSLGEIIRAHLGASPRAEMSIMLFELEDVSTSGVAVCGAERLIESFIEKPAAGETESHWVNAGVYIMEPHLLDLIPEGPSDFGHEVIPALLAAGKRILGVKTQGRVYAVDTPELLQRSVAELEGERGAR
jgi:NDP-sugar pyrophosphorylase family protein